MDKNIQNEIKLLDKDLSTGRIKIHDSSLFLRILTNDPELENDPRVKPVLEKFSSEDLYKTLRNFAYKQLTQLPEIPFTDYDFIINFAIQKTIRDFKEEFKTNILSFFYEKLRGEVTAYKMQKQRMQNKVNKLLNSSQETGIEYKYQKDKETGENAFVEPVEIENPEDKYIREDFEKRQLTAFRMAFSGIPRELQIILYYIGEGKKIHEVADIVGLPDYIVQRKRNYALSLILSRVLRSAHLTKEEKMEIVNLHGLNIKEEDLEETIK